MPLQQSKSEVAHILGQIRDEYEAARQGLSGLSQGTLQHVFITAKMEHIGALHEQLQGIVGKTIAIQLIAEDLDRVQSNQGD